MAGGEVDITDSGDLAIEQKQLEKVHTYHFEKRLFSDNRHVFDRGQLELVVGSVHQGLDHSKEDMTKR